MAHRAIAISLLLCASLTQLISARESSCLIERDSGTGDEKIRRSYYNQERDECRFFYYSGEGGNSNNYQDEQECIDACHPGEEMTATEAPARTAPPTEGAFIENSPESEEEIVDQCDLPLETGRCRAAFKKFGFEDGQCVEFTYGGCDGNDNRFDTKSDCERACGPVTPARGSKQRKPDICFDNYRDIVPSNGQECTFKTSFVIAYNWKLKGCGTYHSLDCGSRNKFATFELCQRTCE